jgi:hypothetical protein
MVTLAFMALLHSRSSACHPTCDLHATIAPRRVSSVGLRELVPMGSAGIEAARVASGDLDIYALPPHRNARHVFALGCSDGDIDATPEMPTLAAQCCTVSSASVESIGCTETSVNPCSEPPAPPESCRFADVTVTRDHWDSTPLPRHIARATRVQTTCEAFQR